MLCNHKIVCYSTGSKIHNIIQFAEDATVFSNGIIATFNVKKQDKTSEVSAHFVIQS